MNLGQLYKLLVETELQSPEARAYYYYDEEQIGTNLRGGVVAHVYNGKVALSRSYGSFRTKQLRERIESLICNGHATPTMLVYARNTQAYLELGITKLAGNLCFFPEPEPMPDPGAYGDVVRYRTGYDEPRSGIVYGNTGITPSDGQYRRLTWTHSASMILDNPVEADRDWYAMIDDLMDIVRNMRGQDVDD
jgi:hypothetical protein